MKIFLPVLAAFLFIFGTSAIAQSPVMQQPITAQSVLEVARGSDGLSFEGFLERLYERFPKLTTAFALMHTSRSRQAATFLQPRVIHFANRGRLLLAYGSIPSESGAHNVEMIEFNPETSRYDFFEIVFSPGSLTVERNPEVCSSCHSNDPHPLWESYPIWPGAYGVRDRREPTGRVVREKFQEFVASAQNSPIYSLIDVENYFAANITTALTNSITNDSVSYLQRRLETVENFQERKFLLQGLLKQCPALESFVSDAKRARISYRDHTGRSTSSLEELRSMVEGDVRHSYSMMVRDAANFAQLDPNDPEARLLDPNDQGINFSLDVVDEIANFRYVTEMEGTSVNDWFFTRGQHHYGLPRSPSMKLVATVSLARVWVRKHFSGVDYDCEQLAALSRAALDRL